MKICIECRLEKPITEFYKKRPTDWHSRCKRCHAAYRKRWNAATSYDEQRYQNVVRPVLGITRTHAEFIQELKDNAIGRRASSLKYAHKRRMRLLERANEMNELDTFVFEQAAELCSLREATTGIKWHIDHIVPLNHKQACGLHCAANFQVVPAHWNFVKNNTNFNVFIGH